MPHDVSLIATLAAGFGLALVLGLGASWLRLPLWSAISWLVC